MTVFKKFCCCCRLETGGLIFGWLGVAYSILVTIGIISFIFEDKPEHQHPFVLLAFTIIGVITLINLTCAALMIVGVYKKNALMILPWLITQMIFYVLYTIFNIYASIQTHKFEGLIVYIIFGVPLTIYLWLCVLSLYQHLRNTPIIPMNHEPTTIPNKTIVYTSPPYNKL